MFDTLEDAINFGKNDTDGGIPLFRYEAVQIPHSDPPEYENKVYVTIMNRGDEKTIIERPKRKEDEKRWPRHWQAFLNDTEAPVEGTPLKEFPALTPADIANLKQKHIDTVEQLAEFPDGQIDQLGGRGYAMKKAAKNFIEYRSGPSVEDLKQKIAELEAKIGDSTGSNTKRSTGNKSAKSGKRNRGRPKSSGKNAADSKHGGKEAGEEALA